MTSDIKKIFHAASIAHQNGDLNTAKKLYIQLLKKDSSLDVVHNNLGLIFLIKNDLKKAIQSFKRAHSIKNENATYAANLGEALFQNNEFLESSKYFHYAYEKNSLDPIIFTKLIISYLKAKLTDSALNILLNARTIRVPEILIHVLLVTYTDKPREHPRILNSLGAINQFFSNQNTIPLKQQLEEIKPPYADDDCLLIDLITKLLSIGFFNNVIDHLMSLLDEATCERQKIQFYSLQGARYQRQGNHAKSLSFFRKSYALEPSTSNASKLSLSLAYNGLLSEAYSLFKRYPIHNTVEVYKLLSEGLFHRAWYIYLASDFIRLKVTNIPAFSSHNLHEKSILVYRHQGLGDEIMFLSCLDSLLAENPKSITLECSERLEGFIKRSFPSLNEVIAINENIDASQYFNWISHEHHFDEAINISALPYFYRNSLQDFRRHNGDGYFKSDPALNDNWKKRLAPFKKKIKVGFAWKGGINFKRGIQKDDLHLLKPLLTIPEVDWFNLQYGDISYETEFFLKEFNVTLTKWEDIDYKTDLENMASLMEGLDLIIQVSNTSLHLAGALGKQTWAVLLHGGFDIRWFEARTDSECPWYSSTTLFRQHEDEPLSSLIRRLTHSLNKLIQSYD